MLDINRNYSAEKTIKGNAEVCEPDYELMLQRAKSELEKVKSDIDSFEKMDDYYWDDATNTRGVLTALYGAMHMKAKECEARIAETLDRIDK